MTLHVLQFFLSEASVKRVLRQDNDALLAKTLHDIVADGCLPRRRSSRDANNKRVRVQRMRRSVFDWVRWTHHETLQKQYGRSRDSDERRMAVRPYRRI